MTRAFQALIRYPLIWIINMQSPDDFQIKRNENCRQFSRLASMRNYLLAHYLCSYQYELEQALLNGETELEIPHLLSVHVENIRFLNFHFYKKSFSEVYVDAFFRADMSAYTGSENNPQRRSVCSDYLIRGYYDFKSSRVRLMQGIMPVSKAYPLPYTELDDYLLPKYSVLDIEETAQEILCENYPYSTYGRINSNILAKALELSIYKTGLGEGKTDGGRFYCRDAEATLYTSEHESFRTTVPAKTILIERSLTAQQQKNVAFHEIAHAVQHSLFYFLQEKYHEDLKENCGDTLKWLPLSNQEHKVLNRMERQADQLGFRLRIPEEGIEELTQKLMTKYSHIEDMREKLSNIISEIASFYDITLIMARNRLIDIGYMGFMSRFGFIKPRDAPKIKNVISTVWNAIKNFISTGQIDIKNTVSSTWTAISDGVKNTVNAVKSAVSSAWSAMPDTVHGAMNNVRDTVFSIWDNVKNGIGDRLGDIRDAISSGLNSAADCVRNIVNSSWQWDYDIMQNFINGIQQ